MLKKKRRTKNRQVISQNALSSGRQKKRFGKKQKKKLLLISLALIVVLIVAGYFINQAKIEKDKLIEKARQGEIIDKKAEKQKLDEEGNPISTHHDTEIIVLSAGNGNATLIKKDDFEVLVDAGAENVADKLEAYVKGDLDYVILTGDMDQCVSGIDNVYAKYKVANTICPESLNDKLKKVQNKETLNGQIIDMGENLSVNIHNGLEGKSKRDSIALVTVSDNIEAVQIVGQASAKDILTLIEGTERTSTLAYICGGKVTKEDHPLTTLNVFGISTFICSCAEEPDQEFRSHLEKANIRDFYTTAKNGNITITIGEEQNTVTTENEESEETDGEQEEN